MRRTDICSFTFFWNHSIVEYLMVSNCGSPLSTEPAQSEAVGLERNGETRVWKLYMSKHMEIIYSLEVIFEQCLLGPAGASCKSPKAPAASSIPFSAFPQKATQIDSLNRLSFGLDLPKPTKELSLKCDIIVAVFCFSVFFLIPNYTCYAFCFVSLLFVQLAGHTVGFCILWFY